MTVTLIYFKLGISFLCNKNIMMKNIFNNVKYFSEGSLSFKEINFPFNMCKKLLKDF